MATIGNLPEFNPEVTEWASWFNRFKSFLVVNGIENAEKKRAALLTLIGQSAFDVVSSLVSPDEPASKTYDELVDLIKKHYGVKKHSYVTARLDFQDRKQHEGERSKHGWQISDVSRKTVNWRPTRQTNPGSVGRRSSIGSDAPRIVEVSRDDTNYTVGRCYELCRDAQRLEGDIKKLSGASLSPSAVTVHAARATHGDGEASARKDSGANSAVAAPIRRK